MPIYVYECEGSCEKCGGQFEMEQPITAAKLEKCPMCGKACKRIITSFGIAKGGKLGFDLRKAKESGMQVLKRRDKGVYEKL